jgi:hypothetical protein
MELSDAEILPLSLEHNFWTWSAQAQVSPIAVKRRKGFTFGMSMANAISTFNSMVMCVNIGHGNQRVIEAIVAQARELPFAGPQMATRPRARIGKTASGNCPAGLTRFLYTLGGPMPMKMRSNWRGDIQGSIRSWRATVRTTAQPTARLPQQATRAALPGNRR